MIRNFLSKIYAYSLFEGFLLIYPVYALLFKDSGLDVFEISLLLIIWMFTALIFEIPTGILADKYSRKKILISSYLVKIMGLSAWLLFRDFYSFALGFVMLGLGGALESGTFDAYIYDGLKFYKNEGLYEKVSGRIKIFNIVGTSIALGLGGFITEKFGYDLVILLSIISITITILIIMLFNDFKIERSTEEKNYLRFLKDVLQTSIQDKTLFVLLIVTAIVFGTYGAFDEFIALIADDLSMKKDLIGVLMSMIYLSYATGNFSAGYIKIKNWLTDSIFPISAGLLMLIIGIFYQKYSFFLLIFAAFFVGIFEIKMLARIQKRIETHKRATILSIKEFLLEMTAIIFTFGIGALSRGIDYQIALSACGAVIMVSSGLLLFFIYFTKPSKIVL